MRLRKYKKSANVMKEAFHTLSNRGCFLTVRLSGLMNVLLTRRSKNGNVFRAELPESLNHITNKIQADMKKKKKAFYASSTQVVEAL